MPGRQLGDLDAYITISPDTRLFRTLTDAQVRRELAGFNPKVRIGADTKNAQVAITSFQKRIGDLSKQLSGLRAGATTRDAESKIVRVQGRVLDLAKQMRELTMTADAKKLDAQIAGEVAKLKGLQAQMNNLQADANTKAAAAKIAGLQAQAAHLQEALDKGKLKSDIDIHAAETKIKSIDAELRVLGGNARAVKLAADSKSLLAQIEVVKASLAGLQAQARDIKLGASLDPAKILAAESALLGIEHVVEALGKKDVPRAGTAMGAFFSSMNRGSTAAAYGWKILTGHITLFGGIFNKLLPSMFTSVAVWHLLIDAAIEIVAVWAPAIIAVTAFGVAAKDAAIEVYNRMKNVNTVMDATHQAVAPLGNSFNQLAAKVRPQVYQLFGDALLVMSKRGGAFNTVVTGTGRVLDQLAARFVYAVTTGGGVNKFMEHAVDDVAKLGDSIGNLGGIFGAVFRAVPGYAELLLSVGDGITKILEAATQAAEPVIAIGLALHGFFIYGGLAVTVSLALVAGVIKLIGAFGKFNEAVTLVGLNSLKAFGLGLLNGIKNAAGYSGALLDLARKEGIAAAGSIALGDAQRLLTKIPTTFWVVAAAAALIGLIHAIVTSRDEAQKFNDTLQQTIQNAPLANVATTIQQAQAVTAAHLADSTRKLNQAVKENTGTFAGRAGVLNSNGTAIQNLDNASRHYTQGLVQLTAQQRLVTSRFSALSKEYGGNTQALGALNLAGITTAQITDTNKDHWAQALIQVEATTQAYKAMGVQAGQLGNDLAVLGRTETDQYTATQKLNQAWTQFITDVTGTQGSFDTVIQGFQTLDGHSGALKLTLGKLKATFADTTTSIKNVGAVATATASVASAQNALNKLQASGRGTALQLAAAHSRLTGAQDRLTVAQNNLAAAQKQGTSAIDALTPAGIALNQAFTDQVQNVDKLFASWRTAGLANDLFTQGVKAAIVPMVKYAGGSQEATAQLVALAEEAGYQGPVSLQALNKWLGNTHDATKRLKDITNQATTQEALLTGAMQAQGSYIANTLLGDINNSILKYDGVRDAAKAYGDAVAKSGRDSDAAKAARQRLIQDLIASGKAAGDSTGQIAALISKVLNIPAKKALEIVMNGLGQYTIKDLGGGRSVVTSGPNAGQIRAIGGHTATGGFIASGTGPTADDVPIWASRGEYVVRASSVAKYGTGFMEAVNEGAFARGGPVSRYATGGLIPSGDTRVLTGQYAVDFANRAQDVMFSSEISAMGNSLKAAEQKALASLASLGVSGAGPAGGDAAANKALARQMFPWPASMWPSYDYLEMREAGYNRFAENPSSGAYGIPQALPPTKMPFAAQKAGGSHAGPQLSWMYSYISSVYGNPVNAAGHERAFNWYGSGGPVGAIRKMASGGQIPLGKYLPQLKKAQGNEYDDYLGLRKAYLGDLAHAKAGSWTSGHRAGIKSELATLAKRQSAEEAAYDNILHHGTARANLSKFATRVRAVTTTSRDKDLSHSHPGWSHGLQYWLGVLTHLSQADVAPVYGGSQAKLLFPAWIAKVRTDQAHETYDYRGLQAAFRAGLSHAKKGTWLYQNRTALGERLYAVAIKQNSEVAAYNDLIKHSSGSVSDLDGLAGRIGKLGSQAKAEAGSLQPSLLGHTPGGHPGWLKALQAQLKLLTSLTAPGSQPFNPPWAPGSLGPSHTVPGGVLRFARGGMVPVRSFDQGGLWPTGTLGWNGSGRTETVTPGGTGITGPVTVIVQNHGVIGSQNEVRTWLQRELNAMARTGYLTQAVNKASGR